MGAVNWIAVVVGAALAQSMLQLIWRGRPNWYHALLIIPAAMLGHALARIGPDKLALKPHLYVMQSAGLALAIVIPALWIVGKRHGVPARETLRDSAAFLLAFLMMGAMFWVWR